MTSQSATAIDVDTVQSSLGRGVRVTSWRGGPPYFIEPDTSSGTTDLAHARDWIDDHRPTLDGLLLSVGAFVLRGLPVHGTAEFDWVMSSYANAPIDYTGGSSPRSSLAGRVYEATSAPPNLVIPLHQEMAYLPKHPSRLAFYCNVPAATDGETLLASVREFQRKIDPAFFERLQSLGVLYRRNLRSPDSPVAHPMIAALHRDWASVFDSDVPQVAEAHCDAMGLDWRWNDDGSLTTEYRARGLIDHPLTGETLYFNHILSQSTHPRGIGVEAAAILDAHYPAGAVRGYEVLFGDGSPIERDDVARLFDVADSIVIKFPWQRDDILVLDNLLIAHGRNRYSGHRDIQVMLLD
jgi:hypothetical protein